ncbi:MAG: RNA polymerase sigma factor [Candidatus Dormibacteria bacterium]
MDDPSAVALDDDGGPETQDALQRLDAEQLCLVYAQRVYRFAAMVSRTPEDAEDLAQDALLRAIRGVHGFDAGKGPIEAWLWRIVVNAGRDAGRVTQRRKALLERAMSLTPRPSSYLPDTPEGLSDLDLIAAVRALPSRQRSLIALRFGADLDYATIGRLLGTSTVGARVAANRAVALLRRRLDRDAGEWSRDA